jgi:hypothetical protein
MALSSFIVNVWNIDLNIERRLPQIKMKRIDPRELADGFCDLFRHDCTRGLSWCDRSKITKSRVPLKPNLNNFTLVDMVILADSLDCNPRSVNLIGLFGLLSQYGLLSGEPLQCEKMHVQWMLLIKFVKSNFDWIISNQNTSSKGNGKDNGNGNGNEYNDIDNNDPLNSLIKYCSYLCCNISLLGNPESCDGILAFAVLTHLIGLTATVQVLIKIIKPDMIAPLVLLLTNEVLASTKYFILTFYFYCFLTVFCFFVFWFWFFVFGFVVCNFCFLVFCFLVLIFCFFFLVLGFGFWYLFFGWHLRSSFEKNWFTWNTIPL